MIQYLLILFAFTLLIKYIVSKIIIIKKANIFLNKYFPDEDKLYTIEEVSNSFKLDKEHFKSLIGILETHQYFNFFNKRGVTMVKDYYSRYELKYLVGLLLKKKKLRF
ncbi:hypothetical protein [uncultured Brachyspira sp.]|uniref:hypothetical protein n=1 Tax=uncultured Brachyspira sp. TaxID=221953 RepID=UPI0025D9F331|nr:hypothetical protein [uncultured Brachyspira sp.]